MPIRTPSCPYACYFKRYAIFGKTDTCRAPTPELEARFLEPETVDDDDDNDNDSDDDDDDDDSGGRHGGAATDL